MMCTAAVCPVSPPCLPYVGFSDDGNHQVLPAPSRKWRTPNSSKGLATFMLNISPLSDRVDFLYKSRFNNAFNQNTQQPFDIISKLPLEISLAIFSFLPEQDLCRVCLVSKEWYSIAQDLSLALKRQAYVNARRIHYTQSKENYFGTIYTPPQPSHINRISPSPALHSLNNRYMSTQAPPNNYYHGNHSTSLSIKMDTPPTINNMSTVLEGLSIHGQDVRRCLFPGLESPGMKRSNCKDNLVGPYPRRRDEPTNHHLVKKSKARLRRL